MSIAGSQIAGRSRRATDGTVASDACPAAFTDHGRLSAAVAALADQGDGTGRYQDCLMAPSAFSEHVGDADCRASCESSHSGRSVTTRARIGVELPDAENSQPWAPDVGRGPVQLSGRYDLALAVLDATGGSTCLVDATAAIVATNGRWRAFSEENQGDQARTGVGVNYLEILRAVGGEDADHAARWGQQLSDVLQGTLESFEFEYRCDSPEQPRWFTARVHCLPGFGASITHVDVSPAKQGQLALEHALQHDPATQLPNQRAIAATIADVSEAARATGGAVCVAMIEMEGVASVSENLGHAVADELLRAITRRLGEDLPAGAILGRFSTDAYLAVWSRVADAAEAVTTSKRLLGGFGRPFELTVGPLDVSASIGVVFEPWPLRNPESLVANAVSATRRARSEGGSRTHLFTADLRRGEAARWRLEQEIRTGLLRGQFLLHYQPVVDLHSGCVVGVEALVRWQHPDGMRMPDTFIPVAEASGLIVPLGAWVLREACRQGATWAAAGLDLRVAVNLSAQQIGHNDIVATIDDALATTGMRGDRLLVEVTESTVLENAERITDVLEGVRARGIEIAIDDFGTGYSSLLYLKRYPIQALKIDRQFVSGPGTTTQDDAIVAGVIALAGAVGATCIAEGVETPAQYELLQALRCGYAQGYLFSRPVPAPDVPHAISASHRVLAGLSGSPAPA